MGGGIAQKGNVTRLNPSFNTIMYGSNSGIANSDMGAFGISPRYAHDWTTHATYTWGKSLDYLSSNNNGVGDGEAIFEAQHPKRQYTDSDYDSRHRFSVDAVRDIPGMHHNSFLHFGRSGFTVSPIIILQAKQAFSVYTSADYCSGGDYNGDGYNYDMSNIPILGRSLNVSRSLPEGRVHQSTVCGAHTRNTGKSRTQCLQRPGRRRTNLAVQRTFKLKFTGEGGAFLMRGKAINLFNRVNLPKPVGDLSSRNFRHSTNEFSPRQIQLVAKLRF